MLLGAAAGGLLGSHVGSGRGQLVGTALGTLAGAALGAEIGRSPDSADRAMACLNERHASTFRPVKRAVRWFSLDGQAAGAIGRSNAESGGCRAVRRAATEAGFESPRKLHCGSGGGSWQVVN